MHDKQAKKGDILCMYGDRGDQFYLLLKGRVSVWVPVPAEKLPALVDLLKNERKHSGNAERF